MPPTGHSAAGFVADHPMPSRRYSRLAITRPSGARLITAPHAPVVCSYRLPAPCCYAGKRAHGYCSVMLPPRPCHYAGYCALQLCGPPRTVCAFGGPFLKLPRPRHWHVSSCSLFAAADGEPAPGCHVPRTLCPCLSGNSFPLPGRGSMSVSGRLAVFCGISLRGVGSACQCA